MSGPITFSIEGMDKLDETLERLAKDMASPSVAENAMIAAGQPIAERARQLTPVETGRLRGSIDVVPIGSKEGQAAVVAQAPHAHLVEFGTANMSPRPI